MEVPVAVGEVVTFLFTCATATGNETGTTERRRGRKAFLLACRRCQGEVGIRIGALLLNGSGEDGEEG